MLACWILVGAVQPLPHFVLAIKARKDSGFRALFAPAPCHDMQGLHGCQLQDALLQCVHRIFDIKAFQRLSVAGCPKEPLDVTSEPSGVQGLGVQGELREPGLQLQELLQRKSIKQRREEKKAATAAAALLLGSRRSLLT